MRNYREAIDIIRGSNDNTIEGRGRTLRRNHFSDGVVRERDGGRERGLLLGKELFWEKNMKLPYRGGAGGLPQKTLRCKPTRTGLHFGI